MKSQDNIPTSKVARATKFVTTGIKIGGNYIKHYAKKAVGMNPSREELHEDNAKDIYNSLSQLKGSALKVAQMLSMDKNILPKAYVDRFTMAQYSAPPLSAPLVMKSFQKNLGKNPQDIYDSFEMQAKNAASMGQVHQATKNGKKLAVKIQYPGVADSIKADLKMVKPFASMILGLPDKDIEKYMQEVETKLIEETDYQLELKRSVEISEACKHIPNLVFTKYYPEYSCQKILTMDWLEGTHLKDFLATNPSQEIRNQIGQALWEFYNFQMHSLKAVHADPHPGNFLMRADGTLGIIDFGCVKEIPEDFYKGYFSVINPYFCADDERMHQLFYQMEYLTEKDTPEEVVFFKNVFYQLISLLTRPYREESEVFDFSNDEYFNEIYTFGETLSKMPEIMNSKEARGSRHSLYLNRTFFGLYSILNELKCNRIKITRPQWLKEKM